MQDPNAVFHKLLLEEACVFLDENPDKKAWLTWGSCYRSTEGDEIVVFTMPEECDV